MPRRRTQRPAPFARDADHTRRATRAVTLIGWLAFLRLDVSGFLWLWIAGHLRRRQRNCRLAAVSLLGLYLTLGGVLLAWARMGRAVPVAAWQADGQAWVVYLLVPPLMGLHALPMLWLLLPGTRRAFERRRERGLCYGCGYDLRHSAERCPECGRPIPNEQAEYVRLSNEAAGEAAGRLFNARRRP